MATDEFLELEVAHLKNAAGLLVHADGWFTDKAFQDKGGRTFYAVDTDVITLFLSPRGKARYADVFERRDEASQLLAWLLADFIFLKADGLAIDRPFLLIPPHDEELRRIADALHRHFEVGSSRIEESTDNVVTGLKSLISRSHEAAVALTSLNGLADWLSTNAQQLIQIFEDRQDAGLELKRLAQLACEGVIRPIYGEVIPGLDRPFPCPDVENSVEDAKKFLAMKSVWLERLRKHKPPKKPTYAIDGDAEVLARLEWANDELKAENVRLILITGAGYVRMAAREHPEKDFDVRYIRHPRSFLAAREMFALSRSGDGIVEADLVLMEWLNLFFPDALKRSADPNRTGSEIDRKVVKRILDDQSKLPEFFWESLRQLRKVEDSTPLNDYVLEWGRHVDKVAAARKVHPKLFDEEAVSRQIANILLSHFKDPEGEQISTEERLYSSIYTSSVGTLDQLYSAPAWIGLWATAGERKEKIKGIPELRFDRDIAAQRYADSVMESLRNSSGHIDLVGMYGELETLTKSNYLAHVVHALAYAAKGHWYATTALCRVAIAVQDCLPVELRAERKGREASYLAAVASRRISECSVDLNTSEQWLVQARRRDDAGKCDLRFESEELAIRAARHFFAHFANDPEPLNLDHARATCEDLLALVKRVEESEQEPRIRHWLLRQCMTNLFSLGFMIQHLGEASTWSNIVADINSLLQRFQLVTENREPQSFSRHVFEVAYVMFGDSSEIRMELAKRAITRELPLAMPFDRQRFDMMMSAARTVLKQLPKRSTI